MQTKLIEKIQKLLSLSESSNEHEAKVAMLKAQELLVKYKLSMQEVKNHKQYDSEIKDIESGVTFKKAKWKAGLAQLIADNFGCYHYFRTNRTNKIVFFGREEDITVCNIVIQYAVDCIETTVKRLQYQYRRDGLSPKGLSNDYANGFIEGLSQKFEQQKKENQEWGLVLVKDKEVVELYEQKKFKGSIDTNMKFEGHTEVYNQGIKDGERFSISDKIPEGETEDIVLLKENYNEQLL